MFGPDVFLIFVVIILFYFFAFVVFFLSVGLKLYFSVRFLETAHLEMPLKCRQKEREHTLKKRGCSEDDNPVKLNPVQTLNLMALFWLTLETRCGCRGVCCRQGKSEQMES